MFLCTPEISVKRVGRENFANPVRCKRWTCPHCAQVNRRKVIAFAKNGKPTAMLTLTVSSKNYPEPAEAAKDLKRGLVALRKRIARKHPGRKMSFIAVFEKHKSGWPHLHLLIRAPFLPVRWLRAAWEEITGSFMVDIRAISTLGQAALYVAKYIGKDLAAFENCKRWWRSHDWNDPRELTEAEKYALKGWTRYTAHALHLRSALAALGCAPVMDRDGRISWTDPPGGPVDVLSAARVGDAWHGYAYRTAPRGGR